MKTVQVINAKGCKTLTKGRFYKAVEMCSIYSLVIGDGGKMRWYGTYRFRKVPSCGECITRKCNGCIQ